MADAHAKTKSAAGYFVDKACRLGVVRHRTKVHWHDAGPKDDFIGGEGKRFAEGHGITEARAKNTAKATAFYFSRQFDRRIAAPWHSSQT